MRALMYLSLILMVVSAHGGERPPSPVRTVPLVEIDVQAVTTLAGSLQAAQRVAVAAEEGGRLATVLVDSGHTVTAGSELARIDDELLQASITESSALIAAAQAAVAEAEAAVKRADTDAAALAKAAERQAASTLDASRASSRASEAAAMLARGRAQLAAAEARHTVLSIRLERLVLRAPFDATIVNRYRDPGAWLRPGDAVFDLVSTELEATVDVPERFYPAVRDHATSLQLLVAGERHEATKLRAIRDLDPATRTFRVLASLADGAALAPGLTASVELPVGPMAKQMVVPAAAVLRGAGDHLYAVSPGEPATAMRVAVTVEFASSQGLVVTGPQLKAGMQVVVEGNERLHPGAAVMPIPQGPAESEPEQPEPEQPAEQEAKP
ncbi:MAG: efflux RND transporter periplasmic adaptor subunit [Planctomycetota bacterium]|jgi:RND family efflux transporter MFP subunit|nr:efflux RND transporter periplasmic adaptor subunit [Planctomycetota bacterium]